MTDAVDKTNLVMTPRAAEAFADFAAMPPGGRNMRELWRRYRQHNANLVPTHRYETLHKWSQDYAWNDRIAGAVTDLTRQRLEAAHELDAETNLIISQEYNRRVRDGLAETWHADDLHPIRDRVKPPIPKTDVAGTVNVKHDHKHSGTVEHAHHDLSHLSDEQIERAIEARRMYDEAVAPGKPDGPA